LKLVYTHPNIMVVVQARSAIEIAGIRSVLRNEYAAGAIGELAPIDAWPEIWVLDDGDYERATSLIAASQAAMQEPDWQCVQCNNHCPATFDSCWHCGTERPLPGTLN